jgi:transposase
VLDAALEAQESLGRQLHAMLSHTREYRILRTIPGVGSVVAAIFIAVIDSPERFETKRKLWSYAGFGLRQRWSGDPGKAQKGGAKNGNRLLKYAAMTATHNAIQRENRFAHHYQKMVREGIDTAMAKKTIARNILAAARAMWISGTVYRDDMPADAA